MDHIRKELDLLFGKDRNVPLSQRNKNKEHFTDSSICKNYLIAFCPHDLFPNTKADMGKCPKRHDEYFKRLFDRDPDREMYLRKYENDFVDLLEKIIAQVDGKIRRTLTKIEIPEKSEDLPKEVREKIDALEKKINFFIDQAEQLGEAGQIDNSEALMKEIERLKLQRNELTSMSENALMQSEKHVHVCEVCGAMQSLTDTEKRLTLHLEGKLHTGYALIRKTLADIKQRREEYKRKAEQEKPNIDSHPETRPNREEDKAPGPRSSRRSREEDRHRSRSRERHREPRTYSSRGSHRNDHRSERSHDHRHDRHKH